MGKGREIGMHVQVISQRCMRVTERLSERPCSPFASLFCTQEFLKPLFHIFLQAVGAIVPLRDPAMTEESAKGAFTHAEGAVEKGTDMHDESGIATTVQQPKKKQKKPGKKPFIDDARHEAFVMEKARQLAKFDSVRKDKNTVQWKTAVTEEFLGVFGEDFAGQNLVKVRRVRTDSHILLVKPANNVRCRTLRRIWRSEQET